MQLLDRSSARSEVLAAQLLALVKRSERSWPCLPLCAAFAPRRTHMPRGQRDSSRKRNALLRRGIDWQHLRRSVRLSRTHGRSPVCDAASAAVARVASAVRRVSFSRTPPPPPIRSTVAVVTVAPRSTAASAPPPPAVLPRLCATASSGRSRSRCSQPQPPAARACRGGRRDERQRLRLQQSDAGAPRVCAAGSKAHSSGLSVLFSFYTQPGRRQTRNFASQTPRADHSLETSARRERA